MAIGTLVGCHDDANAAARRPHAPMRSNLEVVAARRYIRGTGRRSWARLLAQKNVSRPGCTQDGSIPKPSVNFGNSIMPRNPFHKPAKPSTAAPTHPATSPFHRPARTTEPAQPAAKPGRKRTTKPKASADDRRDCPEAQPALDRARQAKPRKGGK